jgi:yecA family protein
MQTVTYDELDSALAAAGVGMSAAETHGTLTGTCAASIAFQPERWMDDLLATAEQHDPALHLREVLAALCRETAVQLAGVEMEFSPLLPNDEEALEARTAALAEWCTGFLAGLGSVPVPAEGWPDTVREIVADLAEIARASVGEDDSQEDSEASYVELVEYLRASTQLVHEELVLPSDAEESADEDG